MSLRPHHREGGICEANSKTKAPRTLVRAPRQLPAELDGDAEALAALGVYDVIIGRADIGDAELWQAVVTLGGRGFAYSYCWMLEPHATELEARAAVVHFLHGVVQAQTETIRRWPPLKLPDEMGSAVYRAQRDAFRDGLDRAWPNGDWRAFRRGHDP